MPADEYNTLYDNFSKCQEALENSQNKNAIAKELLRRGYVDYILLCLNGKFLSSHSMMKNIERLAFHMQKGGIDVPNQISSNLKETEARIRAELLKLLHISNNLTPKNFGTCRPQDVNIIKSANSRLKSSLERIKTQTSVSPTKNYPFGETKKEKMKRARKNLEALAKPKKDTKQLLNEVAAMNDLISFKLSKTDMQEILDCYIDQLFDKKDQTSYQNLAAVVRVFDANQELPDNEGFVGLLSTRIQEKHKEKVNAAPTGEIIASEMLVHQL